MVCNFKKSKPGNPAKFQPNWVGPATIIAQKGPVNYLLKGDGIPEQQMHVERLRAYTEQITQHDIPAHLPHFPEAKPVQDDIDVSLKEEEDRDKEEVLVDKRFTSSKQKTEPDKMEADNSTTNEPFIDAYNDAIKEILRKSTNAGRVRYFVKYLSGETVWVDEEDMDCPELLVKFTKQEKDTSDKPHQLLSTLLETLVDTCKQIRTGKLSDTKAKRRIKELVGVGNPFLKSSQTVVDLTKQLASVTTTAELLLLVDSWTQSPSAYFIHEWSHATP